MDGLQCFNIPSFEMDDWGYPYDSEKNPCLTPSVLSFLRSQWQHLLVLTPELRRILGAVAQDHCAARIARLAQLETGPWGWTEPAPVGTYGWEL